MIEDQWQQEYRRATPDSVEQAEVYLSEMYREANQIRRQLDSSEFQKNFPTHAEYEHWRYRAERALEFKVKRIRNLNRYLTRHDVDPINTYQEAKARILEHDDRLSPQFETQIRKPHYNPIHLGGDVVEQVTGSPPYSEADSLCLKLGMRIRTLRKQHGLGTRDLGDLIKVSDSTISHWERYVNETTFPAKSLFVIAEMFDVSITWLMTGQEATLDADTKTLLRDTFENIGSLLDELD